MNGGSERPDSHLNRIFRILALVGSVSLALGVVIQLLQLTQYGSFDGRLGALDGIGPVVLAQLFMVVGPVALTGAVFALVLLAVRKDRDAEASAGRAQPDRDWFE